MFQTAACGTVWCVGASLLVDAFLVFSRLLRRLPSLC